jgi:hypothetical protein
MAAKRQPRRPARKNQSRQVKKLSPDAEAARDEGPRLIPLPDSKPSHSVLPTASSVALADLAMKLWDKSDKKAGKTEGKQRG